MGKRERVKMHSSSPDGSFLLSGILACRECSSPSAQPEQRLPGVPGRRQPLAGADSGHVAGTRNAVYVWYPRGRDAQPGLLNSANRSCVSSHSSACPSPALNPPNSLCSNTSMSLSLSTPRAKVLNCPSRQTAGNGCGSDNVMKINPKYLEMPLYQAASATSAVKVWLKCNRDRARQTLGFQLLKLKVQEHQQAPLCIKLKDAAYKLHHKRRSKKTPVMAINVPKLYV